MVLYYDNDDLKDSIYDDILKGHYSTGYNLYSPRTSWDIVTPSKDDFEGIPPMKFISNRGRLVLLYDMLQANDIKNLSVFGEFNTLCNTVRNEQYVALSRHSNLCYKFYALDSDYRNLHPIYLSCNGLNPMRIYLVLSPESKHQVVSNVAQLEFDTEDNVDSIIKEIKKHPEATLKSFDNKYHLIFVMGVFEKSDTHAW